MGHVNLYTNDGQRIRGLIESVTFKVYVHEGLLYKITGDLRLAFWDEKIHESDEAKGMRLQISDCVLYGVCLLTHPNGDPLLEVNVPRQIKENRLIPFTALGFDSNRCPNPIGPE